MRRVSMSVRRDTMAILQDRRQSYIDRQVRRRSSVGLGLSRGTSLSSGHGSYDNQGYEDDGSSYNDSNSVTFQRSARSSKSFHIDEDQESTL